MVIRLGISWYPHGSLPLPTYARFMPLYTLITPGRAACASGPGGGRLRLAPACSAQVPVPRVLASDAGAGEQMMITSMNVWCLLFHKECDRYIQEL